MPEAQSLNNVEKVESRASFTCFVEMLQCLVEIPLKKWLRLNGSNTVHCTVWR